MYKSLIGTQNLLGFKCWEIYLYDITAERKKYEQIN